MKKQLLIVATLLFTVFAVRAQQPDTAAYMVHYKFSYVRDTNNRATPYTENMALFLGKNSSAYKSYDKLQAVAWNRQQLKTAMAASPDAHVTFRRKDAGSTGQYFQFQREKQLVRTESIFINSYLINEALPAIDWKISSDTASFGGLQCQKATAHFKGRDYTAWFCPDMPFHAGPWKLNGLPGVILDAYDDKREVVFQFDGVEKVTPQYDAAAGESRPANAPKAPPMPDEEFTTDPAIIELPARGIKTTGKNFSKLQAAVRKDPSAYVKAMMVGQSGPMPSGGDHPAGGGGHQENHQERPMFGLPPAPVNNNPIELDTK